MFQIDSRRIDLDDCLGKGGFAFVYGYKARNGERSDKWAIKVLSANSTEEMVIAFQEIALGFSCDHQNVLPIKGFNISNFQRNNKTMWRIQIKTPRMIKSLRNLLAEYIEDSKTFSEPELVKILYAITNGICYLHSKKIIHRDIKLENVLLDQNNVIKLADIGLGFYIGDASTTTLVKDAGTRVYLAPEVSSEQGIKNKGLYKTDMWSLGVMIMKLCLGKNHKDIDDFLKNPGKGAEKQEHMIEKISQLKGKFSEKFLEFLLKLLKNDPEERVSADKLKKGLEEAFPNVLKNEVNVNNLSEKEDEKEINDESIEGSERGSKRSERPRIEHVSQKSSEGNIMNSEYLQTISEEKIIKREEENFQVDSVKNKHEFQREESLKSESEQQNREEYENKKTNYENIKTYIEGKVRKKFNISIKEDPILRVVVEPQDPNQIKDDDLKRLIYSFKNYTIYPLEKLEGVSLSLKSCNQVTNSAINKTVSEFTKNCKGLIFFELDLSSSSSVTDDAVQEMCKNIGTVKRMRYLHLSLNECREISNESLQTMSEQIRNLTKLKEFKLNLENCPKINTKLAQEVMHYSKNSLKGLKIFKIHLNGDSLEKLKVSKEEVKMQEPVEEIAVRNRGPMRQVDRRESSEKDEKQEEKKIGNVEEQRHPKHEQQRSEEYAEYADRRMNYENVKQYAEDKMRNIFKFQIGDDPLRLIVRPEEPDQVKDSDLNALIDTLKGHTAYPLQNLEGIALYLSSCSRLTGSTINKTVSEFVNKCKDLGFFELNLWDCNCVNDDVVKRISEEIGTLNKLEHLNLSFQECTEISNGSILSLNDQIEGLTDLKTFILNLDSCSKVTTESAQLLMCTIGKHFKKLETLELYFNDCPEIMDEDLNQLSKNLTDFGFLERLTLMLSRTGITDSAIKKFTQKVMRNLRRLNRVELGLHGIDISHVRAEVDKNLKNVASKSIYVD